ncbi:hypothetical protein GCM10017559_64480 [Streptosporangium longisporum]|uniref:Uncharacterized protein n=1 Tax=Streptosporangium longisporum TaxID=46187 RepID=A0ABP6L580_9ACTN
MADQYTRIRPGPPPLAQRAMTETGYGTGTPRARSMAVGYTTTDEVTASNRTREYRATTDQKGQRDPECPGHVKFAGGIGTRGSTQRRESRRAAGTTQDR